MFKSVDFKIHSMTPIWPLTAASCKIVAPIFEIFIFKCRKTALKPKLKYILRILRRARPFFEKWNIQEPPRTHFLLHNEGNFVFFNDIIKLMMYKMCVWIYKYYLAFCSSLIDSISVLLYWLNCSINLVMLPELHNFRSGSTLEVLSIFLTLA